jgi:type II secretory pathway pseudopilin PulG
MHRGIHPLRRIRAGAARGFTLFETIIVIGLLGLVSAGLMAMQPRVHSAQTNARDQYVGLELMRACAERLLAVRRTSGYGSVTNTLCNGMGGCNGLAGCTGTGVGGFAANPTVTLAIDGVSPAPASCSSGTRCVATIVIAKSSAPPASLSAITVEFSAY